MNGSNHPNVCECKHHNVIPGIIVLIGVAFLLETFGILTSSAVSIIWPVLVIIGGLFKWKERKCTCC